jgi:uncharacterized protein YgbK (DUF1537 family)
MGAAIVDAVSDGDLETVGAVAAGRPVSTGASGLGLGIARALVASGELQPRSGTAEEVVRPVGGAAAVVAGSCSRATLEQLALAEASMPVLRLDPGRLLGDAGEVDRALAFAREPACCTDGRDGVGGGPFLPFGSHRHAAQIQCRPPPPYSAAEATGDELVGV